MSHNISKISLNYHIYIKFISFSKEKNYLTIKGFFGDIKLKIPTKILLELDNNNINLYFDPTTVDKSKLNFFYRKVILSTYGQLFNHFIDISIKGIGYKFQLKKKEIFIYTGNSLPSFFIIPENIKILDNLTSDNFSVVGGDYTYLNNFVKKLQRTSKPNKYKETGIFVKDRL